MNEKKERHPLGLFGPAVGLYTVNDAVRKGQLTGRETLYHMTLPENINSILEQGLHGYNPEAPTSAKGFTAVADGLPHVKREALLGKTYFYRTGMGAYTEALARHALGSPQKMIKANVPVGGYKYTANPELLEAQNWREFHDRRLAGTILGRDKENIGLKVLSRGYFKTLGDKNVRTVQGDVLPQHLRKSPHYQPNSLKEFGIFVKNHPKTFATGIAKTLAGIGLTGLGIKYYWGKGDELN